ncbi:hypothetical protein QCA50_020965 [Cerrena zonata]|uniref:Uncharacterized protein n=1 Tax=Cerrena zonata TaxID=2478898 RepID=A0AAW0FFS5_9APHY
MKSWSLPAADPTSESRRFLITARIVSKSLQCYWDISTPDDIKYYRIRPCSRHSEDRTDEGCCENPSPREGLSLHIRYCGDNDDKNLSEQQMFGVFTLLYEFSKYGPGGRFHRDLEFDYVVLDMFPRVSFHLYSGFKIPAKALALVGCQEVVREGASDWEDYRPKSDRSESPIYQNSPHDIPPDDVTSATPLVEQDEFWNLGNFKFDMPGQFPEDTIEAETLVENKPSLRSIEYGDHNRRLAFSSPDSYPDYPLLDTCKPTQPFFIPDVGPRLYPSHLLLIGTSISTFIPGIKDIKTLEIRADAEEVMHTLRNLPRPNQLDEIIIVRQEGQIKSIDNFTVLDNSPSSSVDGLEIKTDNDFIGEITKFLVCNGSSIFQILPSVKVVTPTFTEVIGKNVEHWWTTLNGLTSSSPNVPVNPQFLLSQPSDIIPLDHFYQYV